MNPFKGTSGGGRKRKKAAKVEVKEEPVIKEEPSFDDGVNSEPITRADDTYRAIYNGWFDSTRHFDEVKSEIKLEKEAKGEEKESTPNVKTTKKSTANVMKSFKSAFGARSKRKGNSANVEVKKEIGIKEETNHDIDVEWPRVDGKYQTNYEESVDFDDDYDGIKEEIKCEEEKEEKTNKEMDPMPYEQSNDNAVNDDANRLQMGDPTEFQVPESFGNKKKGIGSSKQRNRRTPRKSASKNQKKHKCHVCNHLANRKFQLKEHLRTHTGEKPHQCEVCLKSFAHKSNLYRHKKTHGQFRCSKCNQGFEHESVKDDHERLCCPRQFECKACGFTTKHKSSLTVHLKTHSGKKPVFVCSICFKSFSSKPILQVHSFVHKDELPYACSKCVRRFASSEEKKAHEKRCQRKSNRCEICSEKFFDSSQLKRHLATKHSDRFPFKCSKCSGGFATEDAKETHETMCGCRQYECYLCKKDRRDKNSLVFHMRKDHTGQRIQCKLCAEIFIRKNDSKKHMKTVHRLKNK